MDEYIFGSNLPIYLIFGTIFVGFLVYWLSRPSKATKKRNKGIKTGVYNGNTGSSSNYKDRAKKDELLYDPMRDDGWLEIPSNNHESKDSSPTATGGNHAQEDTDHTSRNTAYGSNSGLATPSSLSKIHNSYGSNDSYRNNDVFDNISRSHSGSSSGSSSGNSSSGDSGNSSDSGSSSDGGGSGGD